MDELLKTSSFLIIHPYGLDSLSVAKYLNELCDNIFSIDKVPSHPLSLSQTRGNHILFTSFKVEDISKYLILKENGVSVGFLGTLGVTKEMMTKISEVFPETPVYFTSFIDYGNEIEYKLEEINTLAIGGRSHIEDLIARKQLPLREAKVQASCTYILLNKELGHVLIPQSAKDVVSLCSAIKDVGLDAIANDNMIEINTRILVSDLHFLGVPSIDIYYKAINKYFKPNRHMKFTVHLYIASPDLEAYKHFRIDIERINTFYEMIRNPLTGALKLALANGRLFIERPISVGIKPNFKPTGQLGGEVIDDKGNTILPLPPENQITVPRPSMQSVNQPLISVPPSSLSVLGSLPEKDGYDNLKGGDPKGGDDER